MKSLKLNKVMLGLNYLYSVCYIVCAVPMLLHLNANSFSHWLLFFCFIIQAVGHFKMHYWAGQITAVVIFFIWFISTPYNLGLFDNFDSTIILPPLDNRLMNELLISIMLVISVFNAIYLENLRNKKKVVTTGK